MRKTNVLYFCLLSTILSLSEAVCPSECTCTLDAKGRKTVLCKQGGMEGPLSLTDMDSDTEVLKITPPEDNMNSLTMSPEIQSFRNLEEIHILRSNIPILGIHFFWGLKKLDVLDLSQNNITQPLDHNFRGLHNLKELYLDDNRIYSLPSGTFRYLPELRILSLQRNRLTELMPRIFQSLGKLKVLKLSGNAVGDLNPEEFKDTPDLRVLECRGCALENVSSQIFRYTPYLTHLDLGDNELKQISDLRDLERLKSLRLDGNHLSSISAFALEHQGELRKLNLARNSIAYLEEDSLSGLGNLTELDLSYNKLEQTGGSKVFRSVEKTLERLVLSGNHISGNELRESLSNAGSLRDLQLVDCGLANVDDNFIPQKLTVLNLAGNYLWTLNADFVPNTLQDFDISRNRFPGLSEELLQRIENVQRLKMDNNPWSCDLCHIIPLLNRVNKSEVFYNLKCASPYHHDAKILGSLQREQLNFCSAPSYTPSDANFFLTSDDGKLGIIVTSASIALLFLTVLAVLGALLYSRRHAAKYYTHEEKRAGDERESIFENQSPLFGEDRELSFKFPLENNSEKKISIATIDEIKKEHAAIINGT